MSSHFRIIVTILAGIAVAISGNCSGDDKPEEGGTYWNTTNGEWTRRTWYSNVKGYKKRPKDFSALRFRVKWGEPIRDKLGDFCTVHGSLFVKDGKREASVKWFQGVTVYLALADKTTLDWSEGMDADDTIGETGLVDNTGRFEIKFDLRDTLHGRDGSKGVQIGVAFAEHRENHSVQWDSETPVEPDTVHRVDIPAASMLSPELELIHRACKWPNDSAVKLIRAVNALQPVGKNRALEHLQEYTQLTNGIEYFEEGDVVFWIIRLLFEPARPGDRTPRPGISWALVQHDSPMAANWAIAPMACVNDIPMMVGRRIAMGGVPEHPSSHIQWARRFGVMRDKPLRPTSDPLAAAESLLSSRRFRFLVAGEHDFTRTGRRIRDQALAMLPNDSGPLMARYGDKTAVDKEWRERMKAAQSKEIVWDAEQQAFVTGKTDK